MGIILRKRKPFIRIFFQNCYPLTIKQYKYFISWNKNNIFEHMVIALICFTTKFANGEDIDPSKTIYLSENSGRHRVNFKKNYYKH